MLLPKHIVLLSFTLLCVIAIAVEENYPFSHYPMYADPGATSVYYHLADEAGTPLPIESLTGKSSPKLGKLLRGHADRRAKQMKLSSAAKLPADEWPAICRDTLSYLRQQATALHQSLPAKVRLMRTEIRYDAGRVIETPSVLFAE
jgi:hypothetical protein